VKLARRHLLFAAAFLFWSAFCFAVFCLAGLASTACVESRYYGHGPAGCRRDVELLLWVFTFGVFIGGAWLLKRLAGRLGIDLG
jgi:hypothetical protein